MLHILLHWVPAGDCVDKNSSKKLTNVSKNNAVSPIDNSTGLLGSQPLYGKILHHFHLQLLLITCITLCNSDVHAQSTYTQHTHKE